MSKDKKTKKMKKRTVTLDDATVEKAEAIAMGNLSMGLRIAVRDHKQKK